MVARSLEVLVHFSTLKFGSCYESIAAILDVPEGSVIFYIALEFNFRVHEFLISNALSSYLISSHLFEVLCVCIDVGSLL